MSPVCDPSIAAIKPSSLESRFSSPCDTMTVEPLTATPVLMERLEAMKLQTRSPVWGLTAWNAPSPRPATSSRIPFTDVISGIAYAVSYGRPPGVDTHTMSPVRLSMAIRRWERFACAPQFETGAPTITRSPSTTGDIVRPPCVVKAANSSPKDRSQRSFPSLFNAMACAPTLNA